MPQKKQETDKSTLEKRINYGKIGTSLENAGNFAKKMLAGALMISSLGINYGFADNQKEAKNNAAGSNNIPQIQGIFLHEAPQDLGDDVIVDDDRPFQYVRTRVYINGVGINKNGKAYINLNDVCKDEHLDINSRTSSGLEYLLGRNLMEIGGREGFLVRTGLGMDGLQKNPLLGSMNIINDPSIEKDSTILFANYYVYQGTGANVLKLELTVNNKIGTEYEGATTERETRVVYRILGDNVLDNHDLAVVARRAIAFFYPNYIKADLEGMKRALKGNNLSIDAPRLRIPTEEEKYNIRVIGLENENASMKNNVKALSNTLKTQKDEYEKQIDLLKNPLKFDPKTSNEQSFNFDAGFFYNPGKKGLSDYEASLKLRGGNTGRGDFDVLYFAETELSYKWDGKNKNVTIESFHMPRGKHFGVRFAAPKLSFYSKTARVAKNLERITATATNEFGRLYDKEIWAGEEKIDEYDRKVNHHTVGGGIGFEVGGVNRCKNLLLSLDIEGAGEFSRVHGNNIRSSHLRFIQRLNIPMGIGYIELKNNLKMLGETEHKIDWMEGTGDKDGNYRSGSYDVITSPSHSYTTFSATANFYTGNLATPTPGFTIKYEVTKPLSPEDTKEKTAHSIKAGINIIGFNTHKYFDKANEDRVKENEYFVESMKRMNYIIPPKDPED